MISFLFKEQMYACMQTERKKNNNTKLLFQLIFCLIVYVTLCVRRHAPILINDTIRSSNVRWFPSLYFSLFFWSDGFSAIFRSTTLMYKNSTGTTWSQPIQVNQVKSVHVIFCIIIWFLRKEYIKNIDAQGSFRYKLLTFSFDFFLVSAINFCVAVVVSFEAMNKVKEFFFDVTAHEQYLKVHFFFSFFISAVEKSILLGDLFIRD